MTNLEVLKAVINGDFSDSQLEIALINEGLNGSDIYNKSNQMKIDFCWAALLFSSIGTLKSVSELDYSMTAQSVDDIMKAIDAIYNKWGEPNPYADDKIQGVSVW